MEKHLDPPLLWRRWEGLPARQHLHVQSFDYHPEKYWSNRSNPKRDRMAAALDQTWEELSWLSETVKWKMRKTPREIGETWAQWSSNGIIQRHAGHLIDFGLLSCYGLWPTSPFEIICSPNWIIWKVWVKIEKYLKTHHLVVNLYIGDHFWRNCWIHNSWSIKEKIPQPIQQRVCASSKKLFHISWVLSKHCNMDHEG